MASSVITKKIVCGNTKSLCKLLDVQQADVPLTAFNRSDVGPVQVSFLGQLLLGELQIQASLSQVRRNNSNQRAL